MNQSYKAWSLAQARAWITYINAAYPGMFRELLATRIEGAASDVYYIQGKDEDGCESTFITIEDFELA
jgi:hypothetical protein